MLIKNKYVKKTLDELSKLMIGGLTVVSALAWNEAFKEYFSNNSYLKDKGLWLYAIITSLIAVFLFIVINYITKILESMIIAFIVIGILLFIYQNYTSLMPEEKIKKDK